jgi:hypothetical protein
VRQIIPYWIAQIAGAIFAGFCLLLIFRGPVDHLGATLVDTQRITYSAAFMLEAVVWKKQGRIVLDGDQVNVEASRARMAMCSSSGSKGFRGATKPLPVSNGAPLSKPAAPLADFPASLVAMVDGGAGDLAVILVRAGLPRDRAQGIVDEWHALAMRSATALLEDDLQPPAGFDRWIDHPSFREGWLASWTGWAEIEAEARTGGAA